MERHSMFMNWKNQQMVKLSKVIYRFNVISIKIQCNFLKKIQQKNYHICSEPQNTRNHQSNTEKKRMKPRESHNLTSNFNAELQ